ncbi:MAG: adenosylmethionine decarboxylase [Acidobacteriota bacterium]|jgi:S-adenosylmethionine decarboxylase
MLSSHFLIDAWRCSPELLDDVDVVRDAVERAVEAAGATLVELNFHRFTSQGVTAMALLAESHLAVHTWPERGYFAADLFSCGTGDVQRAVEILRESFAAGEVRVQTILRGPDADTEEADGSVALTGAAGGVEGG